MSDGTRSSPVEAERKVREDEGDMKMQSRSTKDSLSEKEMKDASIEKRSSPAVSDEMEADTEGSAKLAGHEPSSAVAAASAAAAAVERAVSTTLHKVGEMLPESIQERAGELSQSLSELPATISTSLQHASDELARGAATLQDRALHNPIVDSYQEGGIKAAAETGLAVSTAAAKKLRDQLAQEAGALQAKLSETSAPASEEPAAAAAVEKKKAPTNKKRKRGGASHGNRKVKKKLVNVHPSESAADTLGDRASELKEVDIDDDGESEQSKVEETETAATDSGVIASVRDTASHVYASVSSTVAALSDKVTDLIHEQTSNADAAGPQLVQKAKEAVVAAKDKMADVLDNASLNADDESKPLDHPFKSTDHEHKL